MGNTAPATLQVHLPVLSRPPTPGQLPPGKRTIKESRRGRVKTGDRERLPKPPTEGALGRPDSRSVIVHFLLECGPFLGPLWPTPSYSPSFSPRSFLPTTLPGSGQSEHGETSWLTDSWLFTSASKPTTHSCSRKDESSHSNHQAWLRSSTEAQ